ncbi:MAG: hypothetical protein LBM62_09265 [Mediterranea sp.]|nr:hypothetical protein [Mediterranea sp.]
MKTSSNYPGDAWAESTGVYPNVSVSGTINYTLWKKLSIGAGMEPSIDIYHGDSNSRMFNLPIVGRIGYDFGVLGVNLSYKHGLMNGIKNDVSASGKFCDWTLSLYIPLRR